MIAPVPVKETWELSVLTTLIHWPNDYLSASEATLKNMNIYIYI